MRCATVPWHCPHRPDDGKREEAMWDARLSGGPDHTLVGRCSRHEAKGLGVNDVPTLRLVEKRVFSGLKRRAGSLVEEVVYGP
jgi:hypothetical protein